MRILVTGATGLIGSSVCARLAAEGNEIVRVVRHTVPLGIGGQAIAVLDIALAVRPEDWAPLLVDVDAIVNCAGVLQDSPGEDTHRVHADAAAALFVACETAAVRRVIHFSAIGVDRAQPSRFSATKLVGDRALMGRDLEWVILRPSVVLGRPAFGASALIRGLAALPLLPVMPATGPLQIVQLDDVVATVAFFLNPNSPSRVALELAGPERLSMSEVVGYYRQWLGWPAARQFTLPEWAARLLYRLGDLAAILGWRPPMRTNARKEIARGAVGDPSNWIAMTGIKPRGLAKTLEFSPATVQEKWFAGLYFVKPAIFVVLPFFWIPTGIISLTTGYEGGVELMRGAGARWLSGPAVVAGAVADIAIGILIAWRRTARTGLYGAIALSFFYAVAGTILRPDLWNEPLGPLMKILPILVLHFVALAILRER
jgi:uncharacterized protein YbjT (DUF2867 family)